MKNKPAKIFVLDTNVILHDSSCIHHFEENDIVIPITVLEELDNFKKGSGSLNHHAREFLRTLDSLSSNRLFDGGLSLGENQGRISIELERPYQTEISRNFVAGKVDHHILNTAFYLGKVNKDQQVILVTKDVNLRMKAKSVGVQAQDYTTDRIDNVAELYTGYRVVDNVDHDIIDALYKAPFEVLASDIAQLTSIHPNEYLILKNARKSALGVYDASSETVKRVEKPDCYGIQPRNAEQTFALHALLNDNVRLVSISGKAGTGKTLLAVAAGLASRKMYRQIFVARPVVPLSNKDLGFLPGDIKSKLDPYMQPLFDNLGVIQDQFGETDPKNKKISELLDTQKLVISALSYIRGRSLVKIFFIVDEAQNLTPHEVKTIITRAGEGTKIIFTGDIYQIDHPYLDSQSNGLSYLIGKMQGQKIYSHMNLEKGERSELAELASNLL